jgi:hypothetical protein
MIKDVQALHDIFGPEMRRARVHPRFSVRFLWAGNRFEKFTGFAREKVYGAGRIDVARRISKLNLIIVQLVLLLVREAQILLYVKSMTSSQVDPFFFIAVMNLIYEKLDLIDLWYKDVWE